MPAVSGAGGASVADWEEKTKGRCCEAIEELISVVKPPDKPLEIGDLNAWRLFEASWNMQFPKDWFDFAMTYGSGSFGGTYELVVFNPFSKCCGLSCTF